MSIKRPLNNDIASFGQMAAQRVLTNCNVEAHLLPDPRLKLFYGTYGTPKINKEVKKKPKAALHTCFQSHVLGVGICGTYAPRQTTDHSDASIKPSNIFAQLAQNFKYVLSYLLPEPRLQ